MKYKFCNIRINVNMASYLPQKGVIPQPPPCGYTTGG